MVARHFFVCVGCLREGGGSMGGIGGSISGMLGLLKGIGAFEKWNSRFLLFVVFVESFYWQ